MGRINPEEPIDVNSFINAGKDINILKKQYGIQLTHEVGGISNSKNLIFLMEGISKRYIICSKVSSTPAMQEPVIVHGPHVL